MQGKKNARLSTSCPYSKEMAAFILTRWARRRLNIIREVNVINEQGPSSTIFVPMEAMTTPYTQIQRGQCNEHLRSSIP